MASTRDPTRRLILLVDDESELREILAEALEMIGYQVVQAGTAEEALTLAHIRDDLTLVVSDIRLPGMSGVELADRLASSLPNLKTILISGYFAPQTIRSRLVNKPFTIRELETAIQLELAS